MLAILSPTEGKKEDHEYLQVIDAFKMPRFKSFLLLFFVLKPRFCFLLSLYHSLYFAPPTPEQCFGYKHLPLCLCLTHSLDVALSALVPKSFCSHALDTKMCAKPSFPFHFSLFMAQQRYTLGDFRDNNMTNHYYFFFQRNAVFVCLLVDSTRMIPCCALSQEKIEMYRSRFILAYVHPSS